ncbi:MAG: hypothetical protein ACFCUX_03495, partial [Candidatus Methylacidiphilales bacterium]
MRQAQSLSTADLCVDAECPRRYDFPMTPHQIKEGFLALPPRARRDMALWIIQTEFSDPAQAGEETSESVQAALTRGRQSGGVSTHSAPSSPVILKALVAVLALLLVLMLAYFLTKPKDSRPVGADKTAELKALAEEEAREAARPESPTNLTYLEQHIGKEVTLRGVPKSAEVGYLHFHTDPTKGVRVKLI